jgi:membrane fusion protein (multidrug efflux system)
MHNWRTDKWPAQSTMLNKLKAAITGWPGIASAVSAARLIGFSRMTGLAAVLIAVTIAAVAMSRGRHVQVAVARVGNAAQVVYATGVVEPVYWAKIAALQRKRIVELCKCEGEPVKAGDVLARLDDGEERAALLELEARLARLRSDAERLGKLVERNVTSQLTYDEKLTQVREQEARVTAQQKRIADLSLKSPIDGVVLRRDGEVGEIAGTSTNQELLWVGRPKPLQVVADINEDDIGKVTAGQKVLLRHEGNFDRPLTASVARVTPKGDPETKTFRAYLRLPDETPLMIGMSVEANIITRETADAILVPAEAVADDRIQLVSDGRVTTRKVQIGIRGAQAIEVRQGIAAGDIVVSPFTTTLEDGTRVRFEPAASR